jgi:hypothetical protein
VDLDQLGPTGANWGHSCPLNVGNTLLRSVI